jgi:hypothetical protein
VGAAISELVPGGLVTHPPKRDTRAVETIIDLNSLNGIIDSISRFLLKGTDFEICPQVK